MFIKMEMESTEHGFNTTIQFALTIFHRSHSRNIFEWFVWKFMVEYDDDDDRAMTVRWIFSAVGMSESMKMEEESK